MGLLIALVCSICWLGFDVARKPLAEKMPSVPLVMLIMLTQVPVFGALSLIEGFLIPGKSYWAASVLAAVFSLGGNVFFLISVRSAPFSVCIPILSLTAVFTSLVSYLILDEQLELLQWLGIGFVILGSAILLTRGIRDAKKDPIQLRHGVFCMLIVSLLWSVVPVFDKIGLAYTSVSHHAFFQCSMIGLLLLLILKLQKQSLKNQIRLQGVRNWFIYGMLLAMLALFLQFKALELVDVGLVEATKRGVELAGSLVIGVFFFKEVFNIEKLVSILLLILGVLFIFL